MEANWLFYLIPDEVVQPENENKNLRLVFLQYHDVCILKYPLIL
jgi:hypothetical protein